MNLFVSAPRSIFQTWVEMLSITKSLRQLHKMYRTCYFAYLTDAILCINSKYNPRYLRVISSLHMFYKRTVSVNQACIVVRGGNKIINKM